MPTRLDNFEASCALVGASILCSLLSQRSFTQQSELPSEIVCWTILPYLSKYTKWPTLGVTGLCEPFGLQSSPFRSTWIIAAGLTISSVYKAENGMVELSPLLLPLLSVAQKRLEPGASASRTPPPGLYSLLTWGFSFCPLVAVLHSSRWGVWGSLLSVFAAVPHLLAYIAWMPTHNAGSQRLPPLRNEKDRTLHHVRSKILPMSAFVMAAQFLTFGFAETQFLRALVVGVIKAFSWFFVLRTRGRFSWCIVPAIQTFSQIAAFDPITQSSDTWALFTVITSGFALAQVILIIPSNAKGRAGLWILLLASLAPYLFNVMAIRSSQSSTQRSFGNSHKHPVEVLINDAKVEFDHMLQRQSSNYSAACDEYRRRYSKQPPEGFEDWFDFAMTHQSPIIDDFDTIYRSVSPFWSLSGNEILHVMNFAQTTRDIELWSCEYSSTTAKTRCRHPRRKFDRHIRSSFDRLMKKHSIKLPDIKFLVNHLDEPRVLVPPPFPRGSKELQTRPFSLTDLSHHSPWTALIKACDARLPGKLSSEMSVLPFVANMSSAMDLCQHPEYQSLHGLLMSPTSFRLIEGPVPVLSTGSPSVMGDILYPSPAYFESEFQYDEDNDVDWEEKKNNLYWAGSNTGGYVSDGRWRNSHRQRFVSLAQNLDRKRHTYLREVDGEVKGVASKFLNGRLFDVAFTKIFQCTWKYCRDERAYLKTKPWADKYKAFRSRLAFDIDGNGISGRYYQLLASKSVPLKQTLLREWHDDRLIPWAHYVPVSQSMEELPELVNYLTTNEMGRQKAREIADFGREWYSKAFREVDFTIYVYRLLLELARLQDPERQAREIIAA